jgi:tRNA threonylcarbamoyladenosine biosynthesis protein TsaB
MSDTPAQPPVAAPVLLALDTATERIHAALRTAQGEVRVLDLPGGAQASATLLPALTGLLQEAGLDWPQVDALAFGEGPGAFTGLRTACATIQGLALGLGKPVMAIDTLMAVAEDARQGGQLDLTEPLWVWQDARMGELYAACYRWDGQAWQVAQGPQLWPVAHPLTLAPVPWAGNAQQADATLLAPLAATQRPGRLGAAAAPAGAALAALALAAWQRGAVIDAALALPRYVRDKVAQTTAERQQARA